MKANLAKRLVKFDCNCMRTRRGRSSSTDCQPWLDGSVASGIRRPSPSSVSPITAGGPGTAVHLEAQDPEHPPDAQAEGGTPGDVAADARAAGRTASLVCQHSAQPLQLLRAASQLPGAQQLPAGNPTHLDWLPSAAQPEEPAHGLE